MDQRLSRNCGMPWWPSAMVRLGASGPPHYCTPPVTVPDVIGWLAVYINDLKKKKRGYSRLQIGQPSYTRITPKPHPYVLPSCTAAAPYCSARTATLLFSFI
mmetsp:Transcript_14838/g.23584  ORF Transcript_14838/g.23584 Transcript_14838/m.23584 type:complete len:102 (-) Transcript_14838:190-495(-)